MDKIQMTEILLSDIQFKKSSLTYLFMSLGH
jgi:hypothetical protein